MALLQLISPVIRAAIAACGLLGALTARGQTIWDGGAGTGNWADAANWNPNVVPLSGTAIQFAGAVQTTVGVVTYEGDRGLLGDDLRLGGTILGVVSVTRVLTAALVVPG